MASGLPLALSRLQENPHDYPAGILQYSHHGALLLYEMIDALRWCNTAEVSRHDRKAEKTLNAVVLRIVELTPD